MDNNKKGLIAVVLLAAAIAVNNYTNSRKVNKLKADLEAVKKTADEAEKVSIINNKEIFEEVHTEIKDIKIAMDHLKENIDRQADEINQLKSKPQ